MTTQHTRKRILASGSFLLTAGLLLAGGMPALADDTEVAGWQDPRPGPIFGSASPESIEAALEVTGWPEANIYAGETVSLTFNVDAELLGAPSLEGELVGLGYGSELLGFAQLDAAGTAQISVRPLQTGPLVFTPFFMGDTEGDYVPVTGDSGTITVDPVPVEVSFWYDFDTAGSVDGYGGSTLEGNAIVEPFCVDHDDAAANDACYATYGVPSGEFLILRDGETIASVNVPGTAADRLFADPSEDLSDGERAEFFFPAFTVPDILLGSPDAFEITAAFDADNWFMTWVDEPTTVNVSAHEPELLLLVGDDWEAGSPEHVNAASVPLTAWFFPSLESDAPLEGTVTFFANGEEISPALPYNDDEGYLEFEWEFFESGEHVVWAEFTPTTLNHVAVSTDEHEMMVIIPPVPNPFPGDGDDDGADSDGDGADSDKTDGNNAGNSGSKTPAKKADELAKTGGQGAEFAGFAGALLVLVGAWAVLGARRSRA